MANWTIGNKIQWNFNRNQYILILENAFENVVCEMAAILSREMSQIPATGNYSTVYKSWGLKHTHITHVLLCHWNYLVFLFPINDTCIAHRPGFYKILYHRARGNDSVMFHEIRYSSYVSRCSVVECQLCVPFTNSLIQFHFTMIVVIIIGIFKAILFILYYIFKLSVPK